MYSDLDDYDQISIVRCKKCDLETHSDGLLRQHKVNNHNVKESKQNIIVGFKMDMQRHVKMLVDRQDEVHRFKCLECEFESLSLVLTIHQG